MNLSWHRFFANWQKDAKVAAFLITLMLAFRFVMIAAFGDQSHGASGLDYILFVLRSMQFDARIALMCVLPTVLLGLFIWGPLLSNYLDKLRFVLGSIAIIATILLYIGDIGFFWEYHDQYNHWVYGLLHDDLTAILETIWKTYPVIWISLGSLSLCTATIWLFKRWMALPLIKTTSFDKFWPAKIILPLILLPLFAIGLRGSIESRPLQRDDAAVTTDLFLNKLVANPYFALYYTRSDQKHLNKAAGLSFFLKDKSIYDALNTLYPNNSHSNNIDDYFLHKVNSHQPQVKPKHIFIIVLESQDNWPFMDEYANLQIVPNMKQMANEGIHVTSFVSAGTSTRTTLNAILTGLPDANVFTNFQPNSQSIYSTALSTPFKQLGYQVNLFYGGHLSWQRLGELATNQGFDNTYGREHMPITAKGDSWGVFDEELFDYIVNTLDPDTPSVNLIMTTSNHSPYPVDIKSKGCPHVNCPEQIPGLENSITDPHILGHQWYNDYCVGNFVKQIQDRFEPTLFAITGDHTSRRFYSSRPTMYEQKSVPLILYGAQVTNGLTPPKNIAGGHIDIVPTLLDYIAPKDFTYHTMGHNLFNPHSRQLALGADVVMTPTTETWTATENDDVYNAFHAIGWWRIMQGTDLPKFD